MSICQDSTNQPFRVSHTERDLNTVPQHLNRNVPDVRIPEIESSRNCERIIPRLCSAVNRSYSSEHKSAVADPFLDKPPIRLILLGKTGVGKNPLAKMNSCVVYNLREKHTF